MKTVTEYLSPNAYPGRGVLMGLTPDGKNSVVAYFIMGRSENSKNRIFVTEGEGIRTEAYDPAKMKDPSLIIYAPVRVLGDVTIATNGDQTDTIYDALEAGRTFEDALYTREFEPDAPNYTPRISGILFEDGGYRLSVLKSADGDPASCRRSFFDYKNPIAGQAHIVHTYMGDGNPLPSFAGEPAQVKTCDDIEAFTEELWDALNPDFRVSLFVRYIDRSTGETDTCIVNDNQ